MCSLHISRNLPALSKPYSINDLNIAARRANESSPAVILDQSSRFYSLYVLLGLACVTERGNVPTC